MEQPLQMPRGKGLLTTAGALSLVIIVGQILNLSQEVVIAATFGTSWMTDAYKMALVIPTLLSLELVTIIGAVVLPTFYEQRKEYEPSEIISIGLNFVCGVALVLSLVVMIASPFLMEIVAGGFEEEARAMAASFLRLLSLGLFLTILSLFLSNILNAYDRFVLPGLQRVFLYGGILFVLLLLHNTYGIQAAVWGYVLGIGVFVILQIFSLLRRNISYRFILNLRHPVVVSMLLLASPLVLNSILNQANVLIEKRIVSGFDVGSLSALDFAFKLSVFSVNFLVIGVNTVIFPTLSESVVRGDHERINHLFHTLIKGLAAIILPITVAFVALGLPIVRLVFERGAFDATSTSLTTTALTYYAIGLSGQACVSSIPRFYQAFKLNNILLRIGAASILFNVAALIVLSQILGFVGIAIATSTTALLHAGILYSRLRKHIAINHKDLFQTISRVLIASLLIAAILFTSHGWVVESSIASGFLEKSLEVILPLLLGGGGYLLLCWLLRIEVVTSSIGKLRQFIRSRHGAS